MIRQTKRPLEEEALELILRELATIRVASWSLSRDLEPLTDDERACGAEPISKEQIQEELASITRIVDSIALRHLRADPREWSDACLAIP